MTFPEVRELGGVSACWPHPDQPDELKRCYVFDRLDALEEYVYGIRELTEGSE